MGGGAGILYGYSFILQHKGIAFGISAQNNWKHSVAFFFMRVGILFFIGRYLLQTPLIPSILGSIGFFSMFWLIILQVKAKSHEQV